MPDIEIQLKDGSYKTVEFADGFTDADVDEVANQLNSQLSQQTIQPKTNELPEIVPPVEAKPQVQPLQIQENIETPKLEGRVEKTQKGNFVADFGKGLAQGVSKLGIGLGKRVVNPLRSKLGKEPLTEQQLDELYGFLDDKPQSISGKVGSVVGEFAPMLLLPELNAVKGAGLAPTLANGALTGGYQAGVVGGLNQLAENGEINPKQLAVETALGAGFGSALNGAIKGGQYLSRRNNVLKRKNVPLTERMTEEQLNRVTTPASQYGVADINSAQNEAIAKQIADNIEAENQLMREYKQLHSDMTSKYGTIENLKKQAVKDFDMASQTGEYSEAINDYRNMLAYEQELQNAKYINSSIKNSANRETPIVTNIPNGLKNNADIYNKLESDAVYKQLDESPQNVMKQRSFGSKKYGKEINEAVTDNTYIADSREQQIARFNAKTPEQKAIDLANVDNMEPDVIVGKSEAVKNAIANNQPLSTAMLNGVARNATKYGQAIESLKSFMPTTPEGIALKITQETRKNAPKQAVKLLDDAENIATGLKEINLTGEAKTKAIEKLLRKNGVSTTSKKVRNLITDLTKLDELDGLTGENVAKLVEKRYKLPTISPEQYPKIQELADNFANATTDREQQIAQSLIKKYVLDSQGKNVGNMLRSYRMMNMLGSIPSRATDVVSTTAYQGVRALDEALAKGIDQARGKLTGEYARGGFETLNPSLWTKNAKRGLQEGIEDVNLGINTARSGQIDRGELGLSAQFEGTPLEKFEKAIRHSVNDVDRAFYEARFASSYNDLMKTGNFTPEEATEIAGKEALENVFQGNGKITQLAMDAKNGIDKLTGDFQVGSHLMPFVKTPTNLVTDAVGRGTGINAIRGAVKLLNPNSTLAEIREAEQLLASGLTGLGTTTAGGMLLNQLPNNIGQLNPQDTFGDDISGLASQSIVLGDKGYSLANAPYLSIPLGIGKALMQPDASLQQRGLNALANTGSAVASIPMLRNVGDITKGLSDSQKDLLAIAGNSEVTEKQIEKLVDTSTRTFAPLVANTINQYIPASGFLGTIRTGIDPNNRETYIEEFAPFVANRVANRLPGTSQMLPEKYNALGEPSLRSNIENPVARFAEATLSPVKVRNYNAEAKAEYDKINDFKQSVANSDIKGKNQVGLDKLKRTLEINGESKKLTNEEYSKAQKIYGTLQKKIKTNILDSNNSTENKVKKMSDARASIEQAIRIKEFGDKPKKYQKYTKKILKNYDSLIEE